MSPYLVPANEGIRVPNNFDVIRIIMAVLVIWSHAFALYLGSESTEPLSLLTQGCINSGNLGVYVFFMVSGFLIEQSFDRSSSALGFLKKRVARIYPGYLVATAVCAFVIIPAYSSFTYTPGSVAKTIGLNLLLRGWFADSAPFSHNPGVGVNGSLWSIPYEFWCYLGVLGLGVTSLLRVQRRHLILLGLVASLAARAFMDISGKKPGGGIIGDIFGWSYLWSKVLPCFLGGMLVYQYREILPRRGWIAVIAVLTTLAVCRLPISASSKSALVGVVFPPAITYVVFYAAFSRQWFNAARYGDFSYGTYLYAFPIEQMMRASYGTSLPFWAYVPIVIVLSLAAGVASWYLVEHWFLAKRPKLAKEDVGTGVSGVIQ